MFLYAPRASSDPGFGDIGPGALACTTQPMRGSVWRRCSLSLVLLGAATAPAVGQSEPQNTFRASTDLIELVVFVVDDDGRPVGGLAGDDFRVTVAGEARPVVLSTFVDSSADSSRAAAPPAAIAPPATGDSLWPSAAAPLPAAAVATTRSRSILLAFDATSFDAGDARGVAAAIDVFASSLPPEDAVGLVSYPLGPLLDPTTDRVELGSATAALTGQKDLDDGWIGPADVIDWYADPRLQREITQRACSPSDFTCVSRLEFTIGDRARKAEAGTRAAQGTLASIVTAMRDLPDPKILVVVTAGLLTSDRPGGRPDVRDVGDIIGRAASDANVLLYGLLIQDLGATSYSAEQRLAPIRPRDLARDRNILRQVVDVMADLAGGTVLTDGIGSGGDALDRIARETRAFYLLTVDTRESDRTGSPLRVTVSVDRPDTTVRARRWVTVPRREVR